MIEIKKFSELDKETESIILNFTESEFGNIPIVKETEWATPNWTIIYYQNNNVASFYNIIERNIFIDDNEVKVSGINNVITPNEFRGNGYASKMLRETENFIYDDLESEFGVLLCADVLIPFYERLNWYKINCPVYFSQPTGMKLWEANVMFITKKDKLRPKKIDLNGLPW